MPQLLKCEVDGEGVACVQTSNTGATEYDVVLRSEQLDLKLTADAVDTGVRRQPQAPGPRRDDFRNDFTHARRAIACAATAGEIQFIDEVGRQGPDGHAPSEEILIRLQTNWFDRGLIRAEPSGDSSYVVRVVVGNGACRPPNARPQDAHEFDELEVADVTETSQTGRALRILSSISNPLLDWLEREASRV